MTATVLAVGTVILFGCSSGASTSVVAPTQSPTAPVNNTTADSIFGVGGFPAVFCELQKEFRIKYNSGDSPFSKLSADNPADLQKFFASFDEDRQTLVQSAPTAVKQAILDSTKDLNDIEAALAKNNWDYSKSAADLAAISQSTTPASPDPNELVATYINSICTGSGGTVITDPAIPPTT